MGGGCPQLLAKSNPQTARRPLRIRNMLHSHRLIIEAYVMNPGLRTGGS